MTRGTVLSMDRKWAYVFTENCRMIKIHVQSDMVVGKEIRVDTNLEGKKAMSRYRSLKPVFMAASLVILLAVGLFFGQGLFASPVYARISVDVNPSLEMALNRELNVISVKALNDEASQLLADQKLTGLSWQDAVRKWIEILRLSNQVQIQNMLLSAVMPENAEQFKTQLVQMEGTANQGSLTGVDVRVIYSNDQTVVEEAAQSGLSIGRQMLLNQARNQNKNWDEKFIADAPLGELIRKLLQDREQNQTRLTRKTTESLEDQAIESTPEETETNQNTNQYTNQNGTDSTQGTNDRQTGQGTSQNTNRETAGNTLGSESGSQQTHQESSQNMVQEPIQNRNGISTPSTDETTIQQMNQYAIQETKQETVQSTTSSTDTGSQASQMTQAGPSPGGR